MTNRYRSILAELAVACFLFVIPVVLFLPLLVKPDTLIYNGDISYFFAHEIVIEHSYQGGDFPLWNPYFGGGSPSLSKIQVGLFYPPMVLLRLLPVVATFNWDAVLNVFVAGLGVYWLVRDMVNSRTAAIFSAIAFMLSGSIMPRVFVGHVSVLHAVVWSGWLLFAYRRMLLRHSWWYLFLTVLFSAFVVLGGHPQISAIVLLVPVSYFVFVYVIENLRSKRWSELAHGLVMSLLVALLTAGLTAAQLIPFAEWLRYTPRGSGAAFDSFNLMIRHSVQLPHLVTTFMPFSWFRPELYSSTYLDEIPNEIQFTSLAHFWEVSPFVGILPLFLIGSGLLLVREKDRHLIVYFIGLALFGLVMSMGTYNPAYDFILEKLPYIRAPGRFLILWTFSLATLAGIFLDGLLKILSSPDKRLLFKKPAYIVATFSLIAIALVVWWNASDKVILSQPLVQAYLVGNDLDLLQDLLQRSTLILGVMLMIITGLFWSARIPAVKPSLWSWLAIAVLIFEMALFALPLVRAFPVNRLVDPQHPLAKLEIDPGEVRIDGYRGPPRYLVPTLVHVLNGEEHIGLLNLLEDKEKGKRLLSATFLAVDEPIDDPDLELVQQKDSAYLYRHVSTSPRIYASDSIRLVRSDDEALDFVLSDSFNQFEQSVLTLSPDDDFVSVQEPGLETSATDALNFSGEYITYGNDLITAQVTVDRPTVVVFGEMYFPGWLATVDGEPAGIFKANYTFRGVLVGEGEHIIEMRYSPPSFRLGAALSLLTIVIMIAVSMWWKRPITR